MPRTVAFDPRSRERKLELKRVLREGDIYATQGETSTFSPLGNPKNLLDFGMRWPEQVRPSDETHS